MIGERIKELRLANLLSLEDLGRKVDKSPATLSRYENNQVSKNDPKVLARLASELNTSLAFLMGMTDDPNADFEMAVEPYSDTYETVLVPDDDMNPEIPYGAFVKIRAVDSNEKLQTGSFYYIEFNDKKCFRMAFEDDMDGLGFMPNDMSERRIAYDADYVNIIGKAISMKVTFEDDVEYE